MLTKTITVHGRDHRVHSLDGRVWSSRKRDLGAFERRVQRERRDVQAAFQRIDTATEYDITY